MKIAKVQDEIQRLEEEIESLLRKDESLRKKLLKTKCNKESLEALQEEVDALLSQARKKNILPWLEESSSKKLSEKPDPFRRSLLTKSESLAPEISSYEEYVCLHGGLTGGWVDEEHAMYLRCKTRFPRTWLCEGMKRVPQKTQQEWLAHDQWYSELSRLDQLRKAAVARWRKEKDNRKVDHRDSSIDQEVKRNGKISKELVEKQRERIQNWKAKREKKSEINDEIPRPKTPKKPQLMKKPDQILEDFKRKKQRHQEKLKHMAMEEEESRKAKGKVANTLITVYRARDREREAVQKECQERVKKEKEEKQQKIKKFISEQVPVNVSKDPARILRPTTSFSRKYERDESDKDRPISAIVQPVMSIRHVPHKAIPSWRKGL
ncbi:unnamed protein product [Darwinula stevensoni]|uniref:Coiled-coil domain-containing protein 112 n=1 Tax=Darwinula stevensoni TaxID=69355 RepID=A0A7R8X6F1_9CRUS|nr:unnamed protein product [Darwinula stevensoni]CAG0885707.1 unnamed protein product [Darwinula stevensoni]